MSDQKDKLYGSEPRIVPFQLNLPEFPVRIKFLSKISNIFQVQSTRCIFCRILMSMDHLLLNCGIINFLLLTLLKSWTIPWTGHVLFPTSTVGEVAHDRGCDYSEALTSGNAMGHLECTEQEDLRREI